MTRVSWFRACGLAAIGLMLSAALTAQTGDPKDALLKQLKERFVPSTFTAQGPPSFRVDQSEVVKAGVVVALKEGGLLVFPANRPVTPVSVPKNGKLTQGFGDLYKARSADGGGEDVPSETLAVGDKVWIKSIGFDKDSIQVTVVTDPYDLGRYSGTIKFLVPKGSVPTPEEGVKIVSEVLEVQQAQDQGGQPVPPQAQATAIAADQGGQPAESPQPAGEAVQYIRRGGKGGRLVLLPRGSFMLIAPHGAHDGGEFTINDDTLTLTSKATGHSSVFKIQGETLDADSGEIWDHLGDGPALAPAVKAAAPVPEPPPASAPAPAPLPDIAPPPPPPDVPPPTIALGQTMDQVTAGFGQPVRVAKLGVKTIFYYRDMKVTFSNGKVSNVE